MHNDQGRSITKVLIVVALIGLIGGIVYYAVNRDSTDTKTSNSSLNKSESAQANEMSISASWQLHDEPRFTLKFPTDWKFITSNDANIDSQFVPDGAKQDSADVLNMNQYENATRLSPQAWAEENTVVQGEVSDKQAFDINGKQAYREVQSVGNSMPKVTRVVIASDQMVAVFQYSQDSRHAATFDKILQTVTFK